MMELEILLERKRADADSVCVLPVWYGINYKQCRDLEAAYYGQEWVGGEQMPSAEVLAHWAKTVRDLLEITAVRDDQVIFL